MQGGKTAEENFSVGSTDNNPSPNIHEQTNRNGVQTQAGQDGAYDKNGAYNRNGQTNQNADHSQVGQDGAYDQNGAYIPNGHNGQTSQQYTGDTL